MCTVTYIPLSGGEKFILTSNRDEVMYRPALPPAIYSLEGKKVVFPRDEKAGGSWIATNSSGRLCCLLNGAFEPHEKKPAYAQSRGTILIEATISGNNPEHYFEEKNLMEVEPFTIVTVEKNESGVKHLGEFIWDGYRKHFNYPDPAKPHIWSSVTLYSLNQRNLRKEWFNSFLTKGKSDFSPESAYDFHSGDHTSDSSVNLVMQRKKELRTISITQVYPEGKGFIMNHVDLIKQLKTKVAL
jgi:hypothetical protein